MLILDDEPSSRIFVVLVVVSAGHQTTLGRWTGWSPGKGPFALLLTELMMLRLMATTSRGA